MAAQSKRFSVCLHQDAIAALDLGPDDSLSGRMHAVLMQHRALLEDATPALTLAQWCAACDALNGAWLVAESAAPGTDPVRHAWIDIADAPQLGRKWHIDQDALVQLVRALPYVSQAALCAVVRRFWGHPDLNAAEPQEVLSRCGARFADAA